MLMFCWQIVFFEMNYYFKTDSERSRVIPELRLPSIIFPSDWDPKRTRQRQSKSSTHKCHDTLLNLSYLVITWLLQHDPDRRPTALQLSQSPLLPTRVEDEYVMGALNMISTFSSW